MKILCVIDHFGSGGAQRQMVNLAAGLAGSGHEVEFFTYFPQFDFFQPAVEAAGIPVHSVTKTPGFSMRVLAALRSRLRRSRYDAAIAFLNAPNMYLELAGALMDRPAIIVSERSNYLDDASAFSAMLHRQLHRLSDMVVANSAAHAAWLKATHPHLRHKIVAIRNGLDTGAFLRPFHPPARPEETRFIAIGRVGPEKNVLGLIQALRLLAMRKGFIPQVTWVGRRDESDKGRAYLAQIDRALADNPDIAERLVFLDERKDISDLLGQHHALIHASFYEGLPNVVCEALAAGRPVAASRISDLETLVAEGRRGYLFDPQQPETIADALRAMVELDAELWQSFSQDCARYAADNLSTSNMVAEFQAILDQLVLRGR